MITLTTPTGTKIKLGLPKSPAFCELAPEDFPPPPEARALPLLDPATVCSGKFCKLPGQIIPEDAQAYPVVIAGVQQSFCSMCLHALSDKPVNGHAHLFGNNTMYQNGFNPNHIKQQ